MNLHKIMIGMGIVLIVFIPIWMFLIVPELEKLPRDFSREFDLFFTIDEKYEIGEEWSGESISRAFIKLNTINSDKKSQVIQGKYRAETIEGDLIWEVNPEYNLNRNTREILDKEGYFLLPKKLEKKTYTIWPYGYNHKFDFKYIGIEKIKGLETYHFNIKDEITDETDDYAWLDLIPDNYNAGSKQSIDIWIEPVTGHIIKFEDSGISYYKDLETDEKVQDFYKWTDNFNDDTIANQVRLAQNEKQKILLNERIIPILLVLVGIALIFSSFIGRRFIDGGEKPTSEKPTPEKTKPVKITEVKKDSGKVKKPLVTFDKKKVGK